MRDGATLFLLWLLPSFLASRGFARRSRARALSSLNMKKKRECSQSTGTRDEPLRPSPWEAIEIAAKKGTFVCTPSFKIILQSNLLKAVTHGEWLSDR